jgi:hypothetical protein
LRAYELCCDPGRAIDEGPSSSPDDSYREAGYAVPLSEGVRRQCDAPVERLR